MCIRLSTEAGVVDQLREGVRHVNEPAVAWFEEAYVALGQVGFEVHAVN